MFAHGLGKKAKDKLSGFKGIITARAEFLTGCNRYCIQPTELYEGRPIEGLYFDEEMVETTKGGISPEKVRGATKGACAPNPRK